MKYTFRQMVRQIAIAGALSLTMVSAASAQKVDNEHQVGGILWTQTSGERVALSYQAFSIARLRLDQDLRANRNRRMRRAVIVDADETVIDNSPYQAMLVKTRRAYESKTWNDWCQKAQAAAIPGAVEFLRYAIHAACACSTSPTAVNLRSNARREISNRLASLMSATKRCSCELTSRAKNRVVKASLRDIASCS